MFSFLISDWKEKLKTHYWAMAQSDGMTIESFPRITVQPINTNNATLVKSRREINIKPRLTSHPELALTGHSCISYNTNHSQSLTRPHQSRVFNKHVIKLPSLKQRHRKAVKKDYRGNKIYKHSHNTPDPFPKQEVRRLSFPCASGCASCAFTKCLGPVKVYVSELQGQKESFVREICDGQGRRMIPRARRKELRGLVYDKDTHSLYPPFPRGYNNVVLGVKKQKLFY